jgi:hypothetical protein
MEAVRVEFEPFIDSGTRRFVINGVDYYNIAATKLPDYFPVNFVLRGRRGDVLGGVLGELWGGWLQVTHLWVAEAVRGLGHGTRTICCRFCSKNSMLAQPVDQGRVIVSVTTTGAAAHRRQFAPSRLWCSAPVMPTHTRADLLHPPCHSALKFLPSLRERQEGPLQSASWKHSRSRPLFPWQQFRSRPRSSRCWGRRRQVRPSHAL